MDKSKLPNEVPEQLIEAQTFYLNLQLKMYQYFLTCPDITEEEEDFTTGMLIELEKQAGNIEHIAKKTYEGYKNGSLDGFQDMIEEM